MLTHMNKNICIYIDDVARFHLRNGAAFLRLNWLGNESTNGLNTSAGLMANYLYSTSNGQCQPLDIPNIKSTTIIKNSNIINNNFESFEASEIRFKENLGVIPLGKSVSEILNCD